MFNKEFRAPWNGYGATHPSVRENVVVRTSQHSPEDLFIAAGCQQGFIHLSTAIELATTLVEAVEATAPHLPQMSYSLRIVDPRGSEHIYSGIVNIVQISNAEWILADESGNRVMGPYKLDRAWTFQWVENPQLKKLFELLKKSPSKGGEPHVETSALLAEPGS